MKDSELMVLARACNRSKSKGRPNMRILAKTLLEIGGKLPVSKESQWKALAEKEGDDELKKNDKTQKRNKIVCEVPVNVVEKLLASEVEKQPVEA